MDLIQRGVDNKHLFALVIGQVKELLSKDWIVQWVNIYKEANHAVDCMANLGHSLQLRVCFYFIPSICLDSILHEDLVGIRLPRLV